MFPIMPGGTTTHISSFFLVFLIPWKISALEEEGNVVGEMELTALCVCDRKQRGQ